MKLDRTEQVLAALVELFRRKKIKLPRSVRAVHSKQVDARNKKNPRSLAQVEAADHLRLNYVEIECSIAMERIGIEELVGILLHELAHVAAEGVAGDPEIAADTFVVKNFPESGYAYIDTENLDGAPLKAIETVSSSFAKDLLT